jgi:UDP-N-acetylmuramate--alanine ligase
MIATILSAGGLDPTVVIGGRLDHMDSGARLGAGQFLVAEADESDGSFNKLSPTIAVITSIDREHMDHYGSLETLHRAFSDFANKVPFYGATILCLDDPGCKSILGRIERRVVSYGLEPEASIRAEQIELKGMGSSFRIRVDGQELASVRLRVPGLHNVLNALAATGAALELELPAESIARGLESYAGVDRRFQLRGQAHDILVVDDYGHHPAELRATLRAARQLERRVLGLFQPHRYSRTADLMDDFARSFEMADWLGVLDIYAAGELPIEGISSAKLAEAIRASATCPKCTYYARRDEAVAAVCAEARSGDLILLMGAGDVNQLAPRILETLQQQGVQSRGAPAAQARGDVPAPAAGSPSAGARDGSRKSDARAAATADRRAER